MFYNLVKTKYRLHRITAAEVWEYVDAEKLTYEQAVTICGPRPQ